MFFCRKRKLADEWVRHRDEELLPQEEEERASAKNEILMDSNDGEVSVAPLEALKRKEFYLLWVTRLEMSKTAEPKTIKIKFSRLWTIQTRL